MKGLSLLEPWASGVALGLKGNETRGYRTKYRGDLAICASKGLAGFEMAPELTAYVRRRMPEWSTFKSGVVVAVANLVNCRRTLEIRSRLTELERSMGDYRAGRWAWIFSRVWPLRNPVPITGRQSVFPIDEALEARIRAELVDTPFEFPILS